jgi:hypothetical protein
MREPSLLVYGMARPMQEREPLSSFVAKDMPALGIVRAVRTLVQKATCKVRADFF